MKRACLFILAAMVATGCSGRSTIPVAPNASRTAAVQFTMRWPTTSTMQTDARAASSVRKPLYVSPSTKSVIVVVNPQATPAGPMSFANKPASGGTTSISIDAPPGQDTFVIELYDQIQATGEAAPAGSLLGQTTVTQTINAGADNTINATVDGVVASITLTPLSGQPTAETLASGYGIVGAMPVTFSMNALDADGNIIVPPGNAPSMSLTSNSSDLSISAVTGKSDEFAVQAVSPDTPESGPVTMTASATDSLGDLISQIVNVSMIGAAYVGYSSGGILLYDDTGNVIPLAAGAFSGVKDAVALTYDYDDNRVFVADAGQGELLAFDGLGNPASGFTPISVPGITGVAYDPHNKLVYTTSTVGVATFNVDGSPAATGSISAADATSIAFVPNDDTGTQLNELAVGVGGANPSVTLYNESGNQEGIIPLGSAPTSVACRTWINGLGIVKQLYVVRSGNIDAFSVDGATTSTIADANAPFGVAVDPNTLLPYISDSATNNVTPYDGGLEQPDTSSATLTPPSGSAAKTPEGIVVAY